MSIARVFRRIVPAIVATAAAQLAQAELPRLDSIQEIEPNSSDFPADPTVYPDPPYFGSGLAIQGNVALVGMPGALKSTGRVAVFVRNSAGTWIRRQTLTASDATEHASFGSDVSISNNRALIASRTAVYIFRLESNTWRETGKLRFDRAVEITDIDWHWNIAVIGATGQGGNAAYAFYMNPDGTFRRVARMAPPDAQAADRFGSAVAVYSNTVAITAPGYNSGQGAAYIFACNDVRCQQRQKLLANDGQPGDDFGTAIDVYSGTLVVGAPGVDVVVANWEEPPSEQNYGAGGAGYVYVRTDSTWIEQQKLRPTPQELNEYGTFGYEVVVAGNRVLVGAPYQSFNFEPGYTFDYHWSGGSLVATHILTNDQPSHGAHMALSGNTLFAATVDAAPYDGEVDIYTLTAP